MSIQVWYLSCLEANCANSLCPKICPNTHTALMDSKQSSQKTTESAHGLQNSEGNSRIQTKKPVPILRKSLGLYLQIANHLDQNLSELSCLGPRGIFWTEQLSEVSSNFWQGVLRLQKLPDMEMPLKIPRFACNICQAPHESPTIVLTKCKSL